MAKKLVLIVLYVSVSLGLYSQRPTLELTFTAIDNIAHVQLDSIKVMNRTQGGDTVLYWPDTVLSIYYVGISQNSGSTSGFHVFQNFPNPVADLTTVSLNVPEKDKVSIIVTDILGRMIVQSERVLDKGKHSFRFTPGKVNLYFFIANWQGRSSSIKILHTGTHTGETSVLEYLSGEGSSPQLKAMQAIQSFFFSSGDELLYIGYANALESGLMDSPEESQTYPFQFATNISCPGTPTVEYEGKTYNTIQIFSQCWLKENLNVGMMIEGTIGQSNNRTIEKYCYDNLPVNCTIYGGLYNWYEMMQYFTQQGTQGICPPGWYIPTDEDWKVLEGAVDSQYGIGDPEWDRAWVYRGFDAGTNLKTTNGWNNNGNGTDLFDFSGLPGGYHIYNGDFYGIGDYGDWFSSTGFVADAWSHELYCYNPGVFRKNFDIIKEYGHSVRCLRDK